MNKYTFKQEELKSDNANFGRRLEINIPKRHNDFIKEFTFKITLPILKKGAYIKNAHYKLLKLIEFNHHFLMSLNCFSEKYLYIRDKLEGKDNFYEHGLGTRIKLAKSEQVFYISFKFKDTIDYPNAKGAKFINNKMKDINIDEIKTYGLSYYDALNMHNLSINIELEEFNKISEPGSELLKEYNDTFSIIYEYYINDKNCIDYKYSYSNHIPIEYPIKQIQFNGTENLLAKFKTKFKQRFEGICTKIFIYTENLDTVKLYINGKLFKEYTHDELNRYFPLYEYNKIPDDKNIGLICLDLENENGQKIGFHFIDNFILEINGKDKDNEIFFYAENTNYFRTANGMGGTATAFGGDGDNYSGFKFNEIIDKYEPKLENLGILNDYTIHKLIDNFVLKI